MPSLLLEDLLFCRENSFVSNGLLLCAVFRGKPCYCLVFRPSVLFHEPGNEGVEDRTSAGADNTTWFRRVGSVDFSSRFRARPLHSGTAGSVRHATVLRVLDGVVGSVPRWSS